MSQWDIKGLETNFEGFRKDRYPSLSVADAFERFAIRQVLKDADLSDDEIEPVSLPVRMMAGLMAYTSL